MWTSIKIPSYLGTESGSNQTKLDEVKMVLYIVEECGMPCFSLAVTEWQMSIRMAEVQPYYIFCFGGGMSVSRRDQGGGLALPESCRGFCQSRYDAYNLKLAMETMHHWRPTLMHLGCMFEILASFPLVKAYLKQLWSEAAPSYFFEYPLYPKILLMKWNEFSVKEARKSCIELVLKRMEDAAIEQSWVTPETTVHKISRVVSFSLKIDKDLH